MNPKKPFQPTIHVPDCIDPERLARLQRIAQENDIDFDLLIDEIISRYIMRETGQLN